MSRDLRVTTRFSAEEAARLDEVAHERGLSRPAALRALVRNPAAAEVAPASEAEALRLLAASARDGSVVARVALARLLVGRADARSPVQRRLDEVAAKRRLRADAS